MPTLRSIVYVSTATCPMDSAALEVLLTETRQKNMETATTGVLLYSDGNFMQCFEGPETTIRGTYARIKASRRHTQIIELMNEPIAERSFKDWTMGLAQPTPSVLLKLSTAQWVRQARPDDASRVAPPGLELLRVFWNQAR